MRELVTREYMPPLAYAAATVYLVEFLLLLLRQDVAAAGVHILFTAVLVLLVMRVDAPPWARLAGYGWAGLALLGSLLILGAASFGGTYAPGFMLATLGLAPGAAWVAGASLADPGAGRALGMAASVAMAFSVLLALVGTLVLVEGGLIVRAVGQLTLVILIAWFFVLGRDLSQGRRHWQSAPLLHDRQPR
ncbi:MAG TPA: hypothetical protein VFH78_01135 [Candidatus Thermoplasmatota archaeon]|nr:hypothetical protein [Candidatus Thermoplasmatota archaeon]